MQITNLQATMSQHHPTWRTFGHNDLQYGNIMVLAGWKQAGAALRRDGAAALADNTAAGAAMPGCNASSGTPSPHTEDADSTQASPIVRLIDYDYCAWSEAAFDIANHW